MARDAMPSVIHNSHGKTSPAPGHRLANPTEAVESQCFPMHLRAPQKIPLPMRPMLRTNKSVPLDHSPCSGEQHGKSQISGGLSEHIGGVSDQDPSPSTFLHINIVVTHPDVCDHAQSGSMLDCILANPQTA